jgi:hypothetical protein
LFDVSIGRIFIRVGQAVKVHVVPVATKEMLGNVVVQVQQGHLDQEEHQGQR